VHDLLPHDRRYFVHKRLIRAATGFIGGGPTGAVGGFFRPTDTVTRPTAAKFGSVEMSTAAPAFVRGIEAGTITASSSDARCGAPLVRDRASGQCVGRSGFRSFAAPPSSSGGPCPGLFSVRGPGGTCVDLTALPPGGRPALTGRSGVAAEAVMGRYGAAYVPGSRMIDRAVCLPGDLVGDDGLCYNRKSLTNKERMWPRGRRPLLTGGEMRAISIAHRAAGRLTRTAVRLQDMGLIKKPVARKRLKRKN